MEPSVFEFDFKLMMALNVLRCTKLIELVDQAMSNSADHPMNRVDVHIELLSDLSPRVALIEHHEHLALITA